MVDPATQGEWNIQGLPTDPLSIQNGVLVTNARRYPLMIDPQGQAISWLVNKEKERIPQFGVVQLDDNRLIEFEGEIGICHGRRWCLDCRRCQQR